MKPGIAALAISLAAVWPQARDRTLPIAVSAETVAPVETAVVPVTLRFNGTLADPVEVIRLVRVPGAVAWRLAAITGGGAEPGPVMATGAPGVESLLLVRSTLSGAYLLDGPFRWPAEPATRAVSVTWRRTVRGRVRGSDAARIAWLPATDEDDVRQGWPACGWIAAGEWECAGVPASVSGVVVGGGDRPWFASAPATAVAGGTEHVSPTPAAWLRLVVARVPPARRTGRLTATARRVVQSVHRPQSVRNDVETDPAVRIARVGGRAFVVSGEGPPGDGWLEVSGAGIAPARIDLTELAAGLPELPVPLALEAPATLEGRVTAVSGADTSGAVVSLYRLGPERREGNRTVRQRISLAEARAGENGDFAFGDLAVESYEIVAVHPLIGRGAVQVTPEGREIQVILRPSPRATGRVVRGGRPLADIPVRVLPDLAGFAGADDVTLLRGGETETGPDGRFTVALAPRGGGELRIGAERVGMRRVPLPAAESLPPVVDLGTIELSEVRVVLLAVEAAEGCEFLFTGPAGRSGMTIVRSAQIGPAMFRAEVPEPGRWSIVGVCGGRERPVSPASIDVPAGTADVTVALEWRRVRAP